RLRVFHKYDYRFCYRGVRDVHPGQADESSREPGTGTARAGGKGLSLLSEQDSTGGYQVRALHRRAQGGMMRRRGPVPKRDSATELIGIDHVYLTVSDFPRSRRFYDRLMKMLGFKKGTAAIGGEPHCHYYNRSFQVSIRPAHHRAVKHDSYA